MTDLEKARQDINEIDKEMAALFERRDVIIVASVSCIYTLGDPIDYKSMVISLNIKSPRRGRIAG